MGSDVGGGGGGGDIYIYIIFLRCVCVRAAGRRALAQAGKRRVTSTPNTAFAEGGGGRTKAEKWGNRKAPR